MLTLGDIYYILFRHKWKILVISVVGLLGGLIVPLVWPRMYESEAKLLIKYVTDTRLPSDPNGNSGLRVSLPDAAGRNIINTELQILTSLDLAQEVATNVGPAKIIGRNGSPILAASIIHAHLIVEAPLNSDVIRLVFQHKDPVIVQQVLAQVIQCYLDRHAEIHRPGGQYDEFLTQEKDRLRSSLAATEESLREIKTNLNIVSLEDSRKVFGDQMTKIQQDIFNADAELAEHQATLEQLSELNPAAAQPGTNAALNTNAVAGSNAVQIASANRVTPEQDAEYRHVMDTLTTFRAQEQSLLGYLLPENSQVKAVHQQILDLEKQKKQMEAETPGLVTTAAAADTKSASADPTANLQSALMSERTHIAALQKRIEVLTNQLSYIQGRATALDAKSGSITDLERTRKLEEEKYVYYLTTLENSRIDETLGPGKSSNINTIQSPSAPFLDNGKMVKTSAGLVVGGIVLALALAFFIELYLDHTVKRPSDVEARLGVPLFLSIPYRNGSGKMRLLKEPPKTALVLRSDLIGGPVVLNGGKTTIGREPGSTVTLDNDSVSQRHCEIFSRDGEVVVKDLGSDTGTFVDGERIVEGTLKADQTLRVGNVEFRVEAQETAKDVALPAKAPTSTPPWDPRHALRPFYDTLRDRLITYFEVKNLTHNPKLVALTSCGDRAGVSSTAAGLAAALSETGEGNVLLVDMNAERGAAHHFYKGHLSCGIDEALKKDKRHEALVQDNLYVVSEGANEDSLPRVLPKRFTSLVPKLKASDYDYIIFDMPPMSQISITPRLARFMDMVMVVVESEKTNREVVQRAVNMLTETRANVGIVLNKRKHYVPNRIRQEL